MDIRRHGRIKDKPNEDRAGINSADYRRFWIPASFAEQTAFLAGYCEAEMIGQKTSMCPNHATMGEIAQYVTGFYRNHPEFARLPVSSAMYLFQRKRAGDSEDAIAKHAARVITVLDKQ